MTRPFTLDPSALPASQGVPSHVAARIRRESSQGFDDLADLFEPEKVSAHSTLLGENEERWPQEVREALLAQHPWLVAFTISEHVTSSSPEGYATGFFRVTPRHIPIATAGAETVTVVTVPFIIRDFKLYPLDLFSHEGKSYPLTQSRVVPLLKLRDAFQEVDRAQFRADLAREAGPFTMGPGYGARGILSSHYKYSEDLTELAKGSLGQARTALTEMSIPTEEDISEGTLGALTRKKVAQMSGVAGAEIELTEETARYRIAWSSDPDTGEHTTSDWTPASLHKLSSIFGRDTVDRALQEGHLVLNRNPADPEALLALLTPKQSSAKEPVKLASLLEKQSQSRPMAPVRLVNRASDSDLVGAPPVAEAVGVLINSYAKEALDGSCAGTTHGAMGLLSLAGQVYDFYDCDYGRKPFLMSAGPCGPADIVPVALVNGWSGQPKSSGAMALWVQDCCLYGVRLTGSTVVADGVTYYEARDGFSEDKCLVSLDSGFTRAMSELHGETNILHLPSDCWVVGEQVSRAGSPITTLGVSPEAPAPPDIAAVEDVELPEKVVVAHQLGSWFVDSSIPHGVTVSTRADALFALAAAGVPEAQAEAVVKTAQETRTPVTLRYRAPHFDEGEKIVLSAARQLARKISEQSPVLDREYRALSRAGKKLSSVTKASGIENTPAVDTVLSLGFLTRENLLRFVDMAPTFETALCYLCAVLLASRLGLDEVDEDAVESAIRGIDDVLSSLRTVEYALTQR